MSRTQGPQGPAGPQGPQGPQGPADPAGPPSDAGPMLPYLTGLVGFEYSSVSAVLGVPIPSSTFVYVPRDDSSHALSVSFNSAGPSNAWIIFFSFGASLADVCSTPQPVAISSVQVEIKSTASTLYFPAAQNGSCGSTMLSAAVLVTGLSAGSLHGSALRARSRSLQRPTPLNGLPGSIKFERIAERSLSTTLDTCFVGLLSSSRLVHESLYEHRLDL
jgi:hypothetical protein